MQFFSSEYPEVVLPYCKIYFLYEFSDPLPPPILEMASLATNLLRIILPYYKIYTTLLHSYYTPNQKKVWSVVGSPPS